MLLAHSTSVWHEAKHLSSTAFVQFAPLLLNQPQAFHFYELGIEFFSAGAMRNWLKAAHLLLMVYEDVLGVQRWDTICLWHHACSTALTHVTIRLNESFINLPIGHLYAQIA